MMGVLRNKWAMALLLENCFCQLLHLYPGTQGGCTLDITQLQLMNTYACVATKSRFTEFYKHQFRSQNGGQMCDGRRKGCERSARHKTLHSFVLSASVCERNNVPLIRSQTNTGPINIQSNTLDFVGVGETTVELVFGKLLSNSPLSIAVEQGMV